MPKLVKELKLQAVVKLVTSHPGLRSGEYARMLGCHREAFMRVLLKLEHRGVLLAEDDEGRLWLAEQVC
jgi:hypothetical protein